MSYIATIDIGTTAVKTLAFGLDGLVKYRTELPCKLLFTPPNFYEQDPDCINNDIFLGLKTLIGNLGQPLAVVFSAAMHSILAVDKNYKPLTKLLLWTDGRSAPQASFLKNSKTGLDIYQATGTPIHPMSPLCKIRWWYENEPIIFSQTYKFISCKEYLLYKLTGLSFIDYSLASATGLFDIHTFTWYPKSLEYAFITKDQLFTPQPPETIIFAHSEGTILTGLNSDIPIIIGGSDGCLANFGSNSSGISEPVITLGTSGAIRITNNSPILPADMSLFSYVLEKGKYVCGGALNNAGIVVEWFARLFDLDDDSPSIYKKFDSYLGITNPGAENLIFLPYITGERAPVWDPLAKGVMVGLSMQHKKEHFYRAMLEGIFFNLFSIGQSMIQSEATFKSLLAGGGLTQSASSVQVLADIFGVEVKVSDNHDQSSIGAFKLALKALKIEEPTQNQSFIKVSTPNYKNHQKYQEIYALYKNIYYKHKEDFLKLADQ